MKFRFILFLLSPVAVSAQDSLKVKVDTICPERDLSDVIRGALNKPPKIKSEDAGSLMLLPIIGSNPATGFMVGVGGQYALKFLNTQITR